MSTGPCLWGTAADFAATKKLFVSKAVDQQSDLSSSSNSASNHPYDYILFENKRNPPQTNLNRRGMY